MNKLRTAGLVIGFVLMTGVGPAAAQVAPPEPVPAPPVTTVEQPAPALPGPAGPGTAPTKLEIDLPGGEASSQPLQIIFLLGALAFLPGMLMLVTSFTRIVIVLGLTRNSLSLQGVPPNQVLIGLALFLTLFVMGPVLGQVNEQALQPYLKGEISQSQAYDKGMAPIRGFMLEQTRDRDVALFVKLSGQPQPKSEKDIPTTTLIPAYVISELRAAFLIGFVIFIPFLVIDMVTSAALMSMGMVMLPPVLISLPFKLLLFVVADGWALVVQSLVRSFG